MTRKFRPRSAFDVIAVLALCLAVTSPAWGDPVANGAASLKQTATKALGLGKKADKRARKATKTADTALKTAKQALAQDAIPGPRGLQGVAGTNGTDGTDGTNGATNVVARSQNSTPIGFTQNQPKGATATCQAGEKVVGGGLSIAGLPDFASWRVVVSEPAPLADPTPTGWTGTIFYTGADDPDAVVTTTVLCASP